MLIIVLKWSCVCVCVMIKLQGGKMCSAVIIMNMALWGESCTGACSVLS